MWLLLLIKWIKKLSEFFQIVLMTSIDPSLMQKIVKKIGDRDKILEIVYMGETKDIMAHNTDKMKPNKMIAIGNINDFDWNLPCNFYVNEDILFEKKKTEEFIEKLIQYLEEKKKHKSETA